MIWEDINTQVFTADPKLYNMLKFGYTKSTSVITISTGEIGEIVQFDCFCPKMFSSITPFHLDDRFRELKRRMIVIPCKRVEELSEERKAELNLVDDSWQGKLIDPDACNWSGFSQLFEEFWDMEIAQIYIDTRRILRKTVKGLGTQQRSISIDLLTTGIVAGIWEDEVVAVERVKTYWNWFKQETNQTAGLGTLLADFIKQEEKNAKSNNEELAIPTVALRPQLENWVAMGWLFEKPKSSQVKELMLDLGMRLRQGYWKKG